ncbi:hypothetical protein HCZ13_03235 [Limosilactobacillus fermentum]
MSDEIDRDVITIDLAITNDPQADLEVMGFYFYFWSQLEKGDFTYQQAYSQFSNVNEH